MDGQPQSNNDEVPTPSKNEEEHAKHLLSEINAVLDSEGWKSYVKEIETNRMYAKGKQHDDGLGGLVRANLIHPEIMSLVSTVYAKDPDISVAPTEAVTPDRYPQYKAFGKTLELVIHNQFSPSQANLKARAKAAVRAAATSFIGWAKVVYQKDYEEDPLILNRIKDVQDDIERINHLIASIDKDGGNSDESEQSLDSQKEELQQMLESLQEQAEVVRSEGLVIDRPLTEDIIWSFSTQDCSEISRAEWITQRYWMTVDKCKQRFGFCPNESARYSIGSKTKQEDKTSKEANLVCVYEMWNEVDSRVYTLIDGWHGYMREPFTPSKVGERFHGFFPLIYDPVDGERYPLCMVTMLRELQDEHNESRTNFRHHRKYSLPVWIGIEGKVTQKDAQKIKNAESMEVVLIEGDETQPIENYLHQFQNPTIDPNVYMTEHIREDWELITRRGDAARGSVAEAKTATEANILQQGLKVSSSEMQDITEEWMREIAQYTAELVLQEMTFDQVKRIAGEAAVWPELTKDVIFDMVSLDIRAGSSGKPDKMREQEQWLKFLPELRDTLLAIDQMESDGNGDRAEILRKLVEETLTRFDEKIDIDEFFPKKDEQQEMQEQTQKMQQAQMQQKAMQAEMDRVVAEITKLRAETFKILEEGEAVREGEQLKKLVSYLDELERQFQRDNTPSPEQQAALSQKKTLQ
jgi:hypothetical protein